MAAIEHGVYNYLYLVESALHGISIYFGDSPSLLVADATLADLREALGEVAGDVPRSALAENSFAFAVLGKSLLEAGSLRYGARAFGLASGMSDGPERWRYWATQAAGAYAITGQRRALANVLIRFGAHCSATEIPSCDRLLAYVLGIQGDLPAGREALERLAVGGGGEPDDVLLLDLYLSNLERNDRRIRALLGQVDARGWSRQAQGSGALAELWSALLIGDLDRVVTGLTGIANRA